MAEYKLLFEHTHDPKFRTLDGYRAKGGYQGLTKAVAMERAAIVDSVKTAGLRGRGGAGAPAALKWGGMPKEKRTEHYLICNADEGEPGTFKDKQLLETCPFELVEGMTIAAFAVQADAGYVYIRGEFVDAARSLRNAIDEAYRAGLLGKNIMGIEGFNFDLYIHLGAGSYECGEETALMSSLMGERGMPRLKFPHAPFPVVKGVWDKPTLIHNVESYCNVPYIIDRGAEWWASLGASTKNSRGTKIFSVSGHVNRPGNFEVEFGTPLMELIELAGGVRGTLKACIPGGSSMPILNAEKTREAIIGYEEMMASGSMVGSGGCMVLNDTTDIVKFCWRTAVFYANESCGKCTPCREGTRWMVQILERIVNGLGQPGDIDLLVNVADQIDGRSFCPLGDAAAWPVKGMVKVFREEFEYYIAHGTSPVGRELATA
ncbi:MAG: NADH-quinone oxidoreductase subunit NuoF [Fimbriimonadaceae bacterium]|nr:NADH-quinone oxidoreductase subunit NuoF [Fimbriimonadaceae bacterium]